MLLYRMKGNGVVKVINVDEDKITPYIESGFYTENKWKSAPLDIRENAKHLLEKSDVEQPNIPIEQNSPPVKKRGRPKKKKAEAGPV